MARRKRAMEWRVRRGRSAGGRSPDSSCSTRPQLFRACTHAHMPHSSRASMCRSLDCSLLPGYAHCRQVLAVAGPEQSCHLQAGIAQYGTKMRLARLQAQAAACAGSVAVSMTSLHRYLGMVWIPLQRGRVLVCGCDEAIDRGCWIMRPLHAGHVTECHTPVVQCSMRCRPELDGCLIALASLQVQPQCVQPWMCTMCGSCRSTPAGLVLQAAHA